MLCCSSMNTQKTKRCYNYLHLLFYKRQVKRNRIKNNKKEKNETTQRSVKCVKSIPALQGGWSAWKLLWCQHKRAQKRSDVCANTAARWWHLKPGYPRGWPASRTTSNSHTALMGGQVGNAALTLHPLSFRSVSGIFKPRCTDSHFTRGETGA